MTAAYIQRISASIRSADIYTQSGLAKSGCTQQNGRMKNLKRIRTQRGLSQADLAALAGVKQATISRIESGANNASLAAANAIANALGVSPVELFGLPEVEQRLLDAFRSASDERRLALLTLLETDRA